MPDPVRSLAAALHRLTKRIGGEVVTAAKAGRRVPSLSRHVPALAGALTPLVLPLAARGGRQAVGRIRRLLAGRRAPARVGGPHGARKAFAPAWAKDEGAGEPFAFDLNLYNVKIGEAVRQMVFAFCESTLATCRHEAEEAYSLLRDELAEGLSKGEAVNRLAKRVRGIFDDPARAYLIARTEASRATHAGQVIAAEESGVVGWLLWMASADACPLCRKLDGVTVALGQDFAVDAGAGAYSRIPHPPRHPRCTCTTAEVLRGDLV